MIVTTMWTHGNSLRVEDPGEYSSIRHRGWGAELNYNAPGDNDSSPRASHIPIPTPESVDGVSPMLTKITILYSTTSNLFVSRVDVWDADDGVIQFNSHFGKEPVPAAWIGNGSHLTPDPTNQLMIDPPYAVQYGIGVSFIMSVYTDSEQLNIAAVGADFFFPDPPVDRGQLHKRSVVAVAGRVKPTK